MTDTRKAMQMALDVMTRQREFPGPIANGSREAIEALRTELERVQEPVIDAAWKAGYKHGAWSNTPPQPVQEPAQ